jgi:uncharacterized protein (DUF4415 family)
MKKPTREQMIKRLKTMRDEDIDYSDIPPVDMRFMQLVEKNMPKKKQTITLRLDPDLVVWLKSQGKGYQTQVNAILRSFMEIAAKA